MISTQICPVSYTHLDVYKRQDLSVDYIIPSALDKSVAKVVAKKVAEAAKKSGVARI